MATVDISKKHTLPTAEAKTKAEELARNMEQKLGIRWKWDGEIITFDAPSGKAKGSTGKVSITAAEVRVEIDLPFLLRPLKGMVESKVREKLELLIPQ